MFTGLTSLVGFGAGVGYLATDLPDLILYLDPSDASTVTLNGGDVAQIDDKSPGGNDYAQATASEQPLLDTAAINGLDAIDFDHAAKQSLTGGVSGSAAMTIICVAIVNGAGGLNNGNVWAMTFRAGFIRRSADAEWGYFEPTTDTGISAESSASILTARYNSLSSLGIRINGTAFTATVDPHDAYDSASFVLGNTADGGTNEAYNGKLGEIIACSSALSNENIALEEARQAAKWGVTLT